MSFWKIVRLAAFLALIPMAAHALPSVNAEITPRLPTDIDEVRLLLHGQIDGCTYFEFPEVVDAPAGGPGTPIDVEHVIQVYGEFQSINVLCTGGGWSDEVRIGTGSLVPGRYRVEVRLAPTEYTPPYDPLLAVVRFEVGLNEHILLLQNGDIAVTAHWTGGPAAGQGLHTVAQSKESGYFWSFGSGNVELTVKVLDGGDVNGQLWLFLAPMTTLGLEVTVYDVRSGCALPLCPDQTYQIPPGVPQSIIDINAFHSEKP